MFLNGDIEQLDVATKLGQAVIGKLQAASTAPPRLADRTRYTAWVREPFAFRTRARP